MPSQLTRVVFRRLIANEPLFYQGCRYQTASSRLINRHSARALPQTQRRTFFDLFKQRRKLKAPEVPAGLEILGDLNYALKQGVRPPAPNLVAAALRAFFIQRRGAVEEFYVARAHTSLKYLLENPKDDGTPWFTKDELDSIMFQKLVNPSSRPESGGQEHLKFGRLLLEEIAKEPEIEGNPDGATTTKKSDAPEILQRRITLLCMYGATKEAKELVTSNFKYDTQALPTQRTSWAKVWNKIFTGAIQEGDEAEILNLANEFRAQSYPITAIIQRHLVTFFATRGDLKNAKIWYSQPVLGKYGKEGAEPLPATFAALLKACALAGDNEFGQQVVTSLLKNETPEKESWDAIFLYSAAIGKGVDEIDRMMNVMIRRNDEARQKNPAAVVIRPDVDTINTLVEFANSREDPYTAERYIALGEKRGIVPNEKTYTMQIQYRLSVRDLDGARAAYLNMQGEFTGSEQGVLVINKLIQALCEARQHHFDELMVMVDDLHERKAYFAPETVTALCLLHLRRGETFDAKDLLQVHAHQFAPEQRRIIQKGLVTFIKDGKMSTADAWDAYQILRNVFQETPREDRIQVMNEFFVRKRSDMACHVFFHMRNHESDAHTANREVYVTAFTGFARCADAESLELAHNQLKLDFNVDLDTQLRNALMMAYAATGQNKKALNLWREICESQEGPSYNSIPIAFRSCEAMHMGHQHAKSIWKRLKEQDVEIDKTIWVAYLCATARNHQHDEALALIETVEDEYGFKPDLDILGNWFNMTASSERQTKVEAWIKGRYPHVWTELEEQGHWVTMDGFGYRQFYLNRDLNP